MLSVSKIFILTAEPLGLYLYETWLYNTRSITPLLIFQVAGAAPRSTRREVLLCIASQFASMTQRISCYAMNIKCDSIIQTPMSYLQDVGRKGMRISYNRLVNNRLNA